MHQPFIRQWGLARLILSNSSYGVDVNMNITTKQILYALTTNCDNAKSMAAINIYIDNTTIKAHPAGSSGADRFFWVTLCL